MTHALNSLRGATRDYTGDYIGAIKGILRVDYSSCDSWFVRATGHPICTLTNLEHPLKDTTELLGGSGDSESRLGFRVRVRGT